MIQIYEKGNTNYSMNGDMVLFPESCELTAKLNGTWKMELVHPLDVEGRWRYIEEECVVSAPTFMGKHQLFRIREVEKTDTEVIATVMPVFLDAEDDCFLMDVRPTAKNGQQALDIMMAGTKYSGRSDITTAATAYFETRNLISALHGTDEPTFTGKWGGEILYDNYTVIINEHVGGDYGVEARYGKNMAGIDYHLDMSEVITRIIPVAYNGYKMSGNTPWVDSGNINKYEKKYIRKLKFDTVKMREDAQEEDEENGIIVCDTQEELNRALTKCCKDLFAEGIDFPVVSIDINMTELSGTEEYKGFEILETVGLGDTVRCRHRELDITTKERVAAIVWDCCEDRIKSLTLGEELYDYFDSSADMDSILNRISGAINDDGSVMAGMIKGFLNAAKTQLRLQNTVAKKQDVRAILFEDLDPKSELFGAMSLGTQGLQIAKRRTEDGRDWDWTTALTANGLIADIIVAGILSDKQGKNYWNLDTGEFSLSATGFKVNGVTADKYFKDNWTQEEIFNKLTNNGQDMGIYMRNGRLYINANYINTGTISANRINGGVLVLGGANNENGEFYMLNSSNAIIGKWNNNGLNASGDIELFKVIKSYMGGVTKNRKYSAKIGELTMINPSNGEEITTGGIELSLDGVKGMVFAELQNSSSIAPSNNRVIDIFSPFSGNKQLYLHMASDGFGGFWSWDKSARSGYGLLLFNPSSGKTSVAKRLEIDGSSETTGLFSYVTIQTTSGWNAMFVTDSQNGNYHHLVRGTSSSKRYKEVKRNMTETDILDLYHISPVLAKYKEGYLQDSDERSGTYHPMFIAEDVEKYAPSAVDHNDDGQAENWNYRVMIPCMFQMIKSQKETIDKLLKRVETLETAVKGVKA